MKLKLYYSVYPACGSVQDYFEVKASTCFSNRSNLYFLILHNSFRCSFFFRRCFNSVSGSSALRLYEVETLYKHIVYTIIQIYFVLICGIRVKQN